jgi:hypothetical protein
VREMKKKKQNHGSTKVKGWEEKASRGEGGMGNGAKKIEVDGIPRESSQE